jgi:hypothetical protein
MQQAIGALIALSVLIGLIVGPIYLAVASDERRNATSALCASGDVACEMGIPQKTASGN